VGTYDGFVSAFLPFLGALTLIYPILAFCDQVLEAPRSLVWIARATAALMLLLSGMAIVDATFATGTPWKLGQTAVACGIGILLAIFGVRLHRARVLSSQIRTIGVTLFIAGVCIASFVLLPVGLLALFVTYIVLAIVLAQRKSASISPAKP
jgi:peptidoglycan/LPS O-acetylase OafA/YrhL